MSINYNGLWKLLIDEGLNRTQFRLKVGISTATLAKLSKNDHVSLEVLETICKVFNCQLGDICQVVPDTGKEQHK